MRINLTYFIIKSLVSRYSMQTFFANLALSYCLKIYFPEDVQKTLQNEQMRHKESGITVYLLNPQLYELKLQKLEDVKVMSIPSCSYLWQFPYYILSVTIQYFICVYFLSYDNSCFLIHETLPHKTFTFGQRYISFTLSFFS